MTEMLAFWFFLWSLVNLGRARDKLEAATKLQREAESEKRRLIADLNRFVALWNAGLKDEAVLKLKASGLKVEEKVP